MQKINIDFLIDILFIDVSYVWISYFYFLCYVLSFHFVGFRTFKNAHGFLA